MNLDDYLTETNTKSSSIAKALRVSEGYISKLRKKIIMPSLVNAIVIQRYCNDKVSIIDLIPQKVFDTYMHKRGFKSFDLSRFPLKRGRPKKNSIY